MTMLSFRVDESAARDLQKWARRLGIDRSELLRDALRVYLNGLATQRDGEIWDGVPMDDSERALADIADWGPAEEWDDWVDATR